MQGTPLEDGLDKFTIDYQLWLVMICQIRIPKIIFHISGDKSIPRLEIMSSASSFISSPKNRVQSMKTWNFPVNLRHSETKKGSFCTYCYTRWKEHPNNFLRYVYFVTDLLFYDMSFKYYESFLIHEFFIQLTYILILVRGVKWFSDTGDRRKVV